MIKNYFVITFRTLWKNKGYSFLNIFGLAIGIACAGFIFLWVEDEVSFDQFQVKKNNLYYVRENQKYDTYTATFSSTPGVLGPAMLAEIPGIASTCRMTEGEDRQLFQVGNKSVYASGHYAEPSVFNMFSFSFLQGNAKTALNDINSIVLTESGARKIFGENKNTIGKTVRVDNKQDYIVTGIVKDIPQNSSIRFEWLMPFEGWYKQRDWAQRWGNNCLSTYVELKPGISSLSVDKILYDFIQKREPSSIARPFLWSMNDWRLYDDFANGKATGGGRIEYVHLFSFIAWIILLIACINFMNLSTAQSEKRAREVGVRKVLGAGKNRLIFQFISEALLMAVFAAVLAVILISITLPLFNSLVQKNLVSDLFKPMHISSLILITIVCGIVAGSYPSLYLSSFNPVSVLKGVKLKTGGATFIRKGLVVLQFSISIILIISTIILYQQIQHVKSRQLGFDKNNLLELPMRGQMGENYSVTKSELLNTGIIENVALSDHETIYGGNNSDGFTWQGKTPGARILISNRYVTPEYMKTSGITLLKGRNFELSDTAYNKTLHVIITESFEKLMGKESGIGKIIRYEDDTSGTTATVVGVVNDYVYGNMYGKSDPVMFVCTAPQNTTVMYIRVKSSVKADQALKKIEGVMKKDNAAYPFEYRFVDDQFNAMFQDEALISKLSRVFASLAIVISCLGLFGLAAYTAERRTKEIGIRKTLGASVSGITTLLSVDFLKLIAISALVAFPIAWLMMNKWLMNYEYRITISVWVFVVAGLMAVTIALITISFQSVKAALMNPVKSLRSE